MARRTPPTPVVKDDAQLDLFENAADTTAVKGSEAFVTVTRAHYHMGEMYSEEAETDTIEVPLFRTSPAYVKVSGSVTRNTGNYNSVRVQVDVSLPSYPEGSELDRVYNICSEFVNHKIQDEVEYALGRDDSMGNASNT